MKKYGLKKELLFLALLSVQYSLAYINVTLDNINDWCKPLGSYQPETYSASKNSLPIFEKYPILQQMLPHVSIGQFPTPIQKLEKLGKKIGATNLYIKNDGAASNPIGGNKIRKLEFLLGEALENGATTVITVGGAGSNHSLATISCAQKLGLRAISVLLPQPNTSIIRRNILLSLYYGGQIHYQLDEQAMIHDVIQTKNETLGCAYFIPMGGSNPLGCVGYVNAIFELKKQIDEGLIPEPDYIYVTLGSSGTAGGIILGAMLTGLKSKIIPVRISADPITKTNLLINLFHQTTQLMHKLDPSCPLVAFPYDQVEIVHNFAGSEYAQITPESATAVELLFQTENIKLETTYTGKTFAALLHDINTKNIKNKNILFWNTFCAGSFEEITKNINYQQLPKGLLTYFENDVQALDPGL